MFYSPKCYILIVNQYTMIHTNRCKHCGKTKDEHDCLDTIGAYSCSFTDSGLAALDAHKEELYEAAQEYWYDSFNADASRRLERIFNQIDKEK